MAVVLAGDELARSRSGSRGSFREIWQPPPDVFTRSSRRDDADEEELQWAAIERLPTYDRLRKGILKQVLDNGSVVTNEVDVTSLGMQEKKHLMGSILKIVEEDNEKFLRGLRDRTDRVGIDLPKIEVRYENVSVEGDVYIGSRALPTLLNVTMNAIESILGMFWLAPSKKREIKILQDVSGIVNPSRMTLLLGPPAAGKTTLLLALAGKLDRDLRVSGKVTYCGHELHEFVPQRTCAYISQHDLHNGQMTVRETLDFSGRCLGVGTRYEMLVELSRREKEAGLKPDPEIDAFMKATAMAGQKTSLVTDYVLKILGLDICADIIVGDEMMRGISGGQRKRVTTGEMLVGPAKALFMDEISTGLDSSTTFQIVKFMRQMVHIMDVTMVISLLQPAPETYDLFDDIILLSEGQIIYQGPRESVLEFFEFMGFKCPERKGVADFLQEVTSMKDQEQYWFRRDQPYRYIPVSEFAKAFSTFHVGKELAAHLSTPYDKAKTHSAALAVEKYGISNWELLKACFAREWLLMKRSSFVYIFKTTQITIMSVITMTVFFRTEMQAGTLEGGGKFFGALFFSLLNVMFNGVAELAMTVFRLPHGLLLCQFGSSGSPYRSWNQQYGWFSHITQLGLLQLPADDIKPWLRWAYYVSPMMYGQNAIAINEFIDKRWSVPSMDPRYNATTIGKVLLRSRGFFTEDKWFWICIGALVGFSLLFNLLFIAALTFLNQLPGNSISAFGDSKAIIQEDDTKKQPTSQQNRGEGPEGLCQCLSLIVSNCYEQTYEMTSQGVEGDRLQLLKDVSGAFRPGILTALVGVSGAGKTTLMDVLAGRKTGGYIDGSVMISGYPKNQATFARVSGYCEQTDIHSPYVTVYESLLFSAWLRLSSDVNKETRKMFVEEVMELVELNPIRDALVGLPGVDGLSTEQRKRVTIAVELVANPSIIFMDEPTSGLDARAAAIVMRTVRNTVDTGRTVVCTIHQPSIDIFEAFDELLLMKRGGQVIYAGPLGRQSHKLVEYFEAVPGVPKIKDGLNPATWMLDVTAPQVEAQLNVDFAEVYASSPLYLRNQELIKELSTPPPGSNDLYFATKYSQPFIVQCKACVWKQHWSYWRNPKYNAIRFLMTVVIGILFGVIFWKKGTKIEKQQDLLNILGAMYSAVLFLGSSNASTVQAVVAIERTVSYRERAAGMYSALPYAFGQVAVEISYVVVQTVIYGLLLYSMIGFEWTAGKFFWFQYYMLTCFIYYTLYGMAILAATPGHQIAAILMSFFVSFWNLFSGFLIFRPQIPIWWRWYYWLSPVAWTLYGLVTSQFGDLDTAVEVPGMPDMTVKKFLKAELGYDYDFLPAVAVAHAVWALLFFFVFAYAIKFLNYQRR
ncbi:hypothetical protein RJ640_030943 [Escallonia rubra]|uniref:ABC transporter domain-containing protein n=1 Tax=Escallonia rubra TaxID=112253 RepID=A0AA88R661_9ASTE|nr:hypothetical protein RJ640_030943 [Escallonia rubra]